MSRKSNGDIEIAFDHANNIAAVEESDRETTDNFERLSNIEDSIQNILNLDDQDNDSKDNKIQQSEIPSVEIETISGKQHLNNKKYPLINKSPCKALPEHPSTWPQRPLMIRPTPLSSTKVIGVVSYKPICCLPSLSCFISYMFCALSNWNFHVNLLSISVWQKEVTTWAFLQAASFLSTMVQRLRGKH